MKEIIDELYTRNLYVILDFHQDIANEVYGGDGFPDWALEIDKIMKDRSVQMLTRNGKSNICSTSH